MERLATHPRRSPCPILPGLNEFFFKVCLISKFQPLGTEKSLLYNMASVKPNGATTFIELIRGGSTHFLKQISTGQKLFMSSR